MKQQWCIPALDGAYIAAMEDVLDLYAEPYDPRFPVVCFDECPYGFTGATREPIPMAPDRVRREDYEYTRHGSGAFLGVFQPLTGWRQITVSHQRTRHEVAEQLRRLVEEHFPEAERIRVVMDNLNTHPLGALYDTFPAAQARAIARKLEFHYTPKHGSWLNMIEIEWSILARQCLGQRIPDVPVLQPEVDAWAAERNARQAMIDWRFTTARARSTFETRYPTVGDDPS